MNNKRNVKTLVSDCLLLVLSLLLCLGTKFIFHACPGPMESGMWMSCHWAEQAVAGIGAALSVTAVINLILKKQSTKNGLVTAMIPTALLAALTPNVLIKLCMMKDMQCHTHMRPAVIVISLLIVIVSAVYVLINRKAD